MRKADRLPDKWWRIVFFLTGLLIVTADQLSKIWIRTNLAVGQSLPEVGFPQLTRVNNTGAAFGLFQGQTFLLSIIALVGVIVLLAVVIYRRSPFLNSRLAWVSLGLLLGGTVGNLIDRVLFQEVADFLDFMIAGHHWPVFNVADSSVTVGMFFFLYYSLILQPKLETAHSPN